ncbi:odorant receptor 30a-like isoform X2 [Cylas formicarius]|uniref:odorant receptor 30a-like isoform X2 n=1 Tax=Cylas formicarius TaxID=197179 RepID=UPI002958A2F8|nr:odorant receptor 30a-like isoform X2 [Cylas formicarius]
MTISHRRSEILKLSKYSLVVAGVWRFSWTKSPSLQIFYRFYSVLIQIYYPACLTSLATRFAISSVRETPSDISTFFRTFAMTITLTIVQIKVVLFQTRAVKQIIRQIMDEEKSILGSNDEEILQRYSAQVALCRIWNLAIFWLIFGSGTGMILGNVLQRLQTKEESRESNRTIPKPYLYDFYYASFDVEEHSTILTLVNYAYMVVSGCMISTQVILVSCMMFASSMLKTLQVRFKKASCYDADILLTLKRLVMEHQHVIRFVKKLNNSTKHLMLLEYLLNSVNVASVSIQFLVTKPGASLAFPACHFGLLLVQIFSLGWSADEIRMQVRHFASKFSRVSLNLSKSLGLADALYESSWFEQSENAKRLVLVMITRAQRPLALTIGPLSAMTNQSALTIMKASYSYVTLMANSYG